jgi:hypothetical protein
VASQFHQSLAPGKPVVRTSSPRSLPELMNRPPSVHAPPLPIEIPEMGLLNRPQKAFNGFQLGTAEGTEGTECIRRDMQVAGNRLNCAMLVRFAVPRRCPLAAWYALRVEACPDRNRTLRSQDHRQWR